MILRQVTEHVKARKWATVGFDFVIVVGVFIGIQVANWSHAHAQGEIPEHPVDAYVEAGMEELGVPGAAVAIFEGNEIVRVKGFGVTAADDGSAITPQTPFQTGSVSKSFAALAAVQLASEGPISLEDPVVKYLPDFRTRDAKTSAKITVRHLISHHSGISQVDGNHYQTLTDRSDNAFAPAMRGLEKVKLNGEPGTHFEYSNLNYILLVKLIESVEQKPFEEVLEARIFGPLGMKNSYVQVAKKPTVAPAIGHRQWFGATQEFEFIPGRIMMGAGGVTASAEDLATYLVAVANRDPRIIPPEYAEDIHTAYGGNANGYGLGWEVRERDGAKLIFHSGLNPGFAARVAFTTEPVRGGLILTNMAGSLDGELVLGTLNEIMGFPEVDASPTPTELGQLWGGLVITVLLLIGFIFLTLRLIKKSESVGPLKTFLPSLVLFALAYGFHFAIPAALGAPVDAARIFYPDLGLLLITSAAVSALWAATRLLLIWRINT